MDKITITKEEFIDKSVQTLRKFMDDRKIEGTKQAILMLLFATFSARLTEEMFDEENVVE